MQLRSEETRQRILDVAARLFSDKGFDGTGVAEICEVSGVSKGAFYHHFPSKQTVFLQLLQDWLAGLDAQMTIAEQKAADVPTALLAMATEMKEVFTAADGRVHLFLEFWQQAGRHPDVWKEFIAPYRRYQQFFARIIERGIAEGSLRSIDPQGAGHALVSLAVGVVVQAVLDARGAAWDEVTKNAVRLLLEGMAARPSARSKER